MAGVSGGAIPEEDGRASGILSGRRDEVLRGGGWEAQAGSLEAAPSGDDGIARDEAAARSEDGPAARAGDDGGAARSSGGTGARIEGYRPPSDARGRPDGLGRFHPLAVAEVRPEGEGAVAVSFAVPEDLREAFRHRAGQYLTLRRRDEAGREHRRSYSIACAPGRGVCVGIRRVPGGAFSDWAQALKPGDVVETMPPQGRFVSAGEREVLLIAAGSGVTPMVAIAAEALERGASATLLYGNRSARSIMFKDALEAMKDRYLGRFRLVHVLSREARDVAILSGRVDGAKVADLARLGVIDPLGAGAVFLCGPGAMIDEVSQALRSLGVPQGRIRTERFTDGAAAPSRAASREAQAGVMDGVCVEVVLDGARRGFDLGEGDASVLEAAERAGLDLPWSCRGGMCCTCRCRVLEGAAEMAVNFSLEPWEIAAGFTLACQARPTSERLVLDFDAV